MKKIVALSIIVFCSLTLVRSQTIRFGVDPGLALSYGNYKPDYGLERRIYAGFDGGILVEIGINKVKLQPEVNLSLVGVELNFGTGEYTIKHRYINVPVLLKFLPGKFNLLTGPQVGFLFSSKRDWSGTQPTEDIKDLFKSTDFEWVFGAEYKLTKQLFLGVRYTAGLVNVSDDNSFKMYNGYGSVRVGYLFDLSK